MALAKGMRRLFELLKANSIGNTVTTDELLEATGWTLSTLTTYHKKNKLDTLLRILPSGSFEVLKGGSMLSESEVESVLTQVNPSVLVLTKQDRLSGERDSYALQSPIGQGAVGHVWKARAIKANRLVAVKVVNPRQDLLSADVLPDVMARFEREADNGLQLDHHTVIRYLDRGSFRGHPFLVMDLAQSSLADDLDNGGPVLLIDTLAIILRCLDALEYLHNLKLVHRDIKPGNILRFAGGYVLGDLGIVKWSDFSHGFKNAGTLTKSSIQLGSWFYMAPEQERDSRQVVPASDIYSLGATWYKMLTGTEGSPASFAAQEFTPPSANKQVNDLISRMVRYKPDQRGTIQEIRSTILALS